MGFYAIAAMHTTPFDQSYENFQVKRVGDAENELGTLVRNQEQLKRTATTLSGSQFTFLPASRFLTVSSHMLSIAENQWGLSGDTDSQAGKNRGRQKLQISTGRRTYLPIVVFGCFHPTYLEFRKICDSFGGSV